MSRRKRFETYIADHGFNRRKHVDFYWSSNIRKGTGFSLKAEPVCGNRPKNRMKQHSFDSQYCRQHSNLPAVRLKRLRISISCYINPTLIVKLFLFLIWVKKSICYAYIPADQADPGNDFEIESYTFEDNPYSTARPNLVGPNLGAGTRRSITRMDFHLPLRKRR
jgi:hypothetical protein